MAQETKHFDDKVPQNIRDRIAELVQAVHDDFISDQRDAHGCARIDEISGVPIPGFWPFQDGGFQVSEFYRSDIDSSYHFTPSQTDAMNEQQEYCYECFASDHKDKLLAAGISEEKLEDTDYRDIEKAELENEFADYENEFFEPALLRVEIWVEKESVYCRLSVNYKDQPYYRSEYDETICEFNLTFEEALSITSEDFIKRLDKGLHDIWQEKAA